MTARGAYIAAGEAGGRQVTLMASGSEVGIAMSAREMLAADGIAATVVSVPCMELFWQQDAAWQKMVLGTAPRIAIEAAIRQPWDRVLGENDALSGWMISGHRHLPATCSRISGSPPTPSPQPQSTRRLSSVGTD